MPLIQVKMIEKVFTPVQKQELITRLTDAIGLESTRTAPAVPC